MNLLTLPADQMFANVLALLVCAGIVVSCVLRINVTKALPWRVELIQFALVCFAFWAAALARDLWLGVPLSLCDAAAGLGLAAYLLSTSRKWRAHERRRAQDDCSEEDVMRLVQSAPRVRTLPPSHGTGDDHAQHVPARFH